MGIFTVNGILQGFGGGGGQGGTDTGQFEVSNIFRITTGYLVQATDRGRLILFEGTETSVVTLPVPINGQVFHLSNTSSVDVTVRIHGNTTGAEFTLKSGRSKTFIADGDNSIYLPFNLDLPDDFVDADILGDGVVGTIHVEDSAIITAKLADNAVTAAKLSFDSVTTDKIVDGSVSTNKLADNSVTSGKVADSAITSTKVADDAVNTSKIVDDAVTEAKLADDAVSTDKIVDGDVTRVKLATDSVDGAKIARNVISSSHLSDSAVTNPKIADSAVTTAKLATDSVDGSKIARNAISSAHLSDSSVINSKLATDSVDGAKIARNAISTTHINDSNVTEAKLADGAVTQDKIATDAVNGAKIARNSIAAGHLNGNIITGQPAETELENTDQILLGDVSDNNNLKRVTLATLANQVGGNGGGANVYGSEYARRSDTDTQFLRSTGRTNLIDLNFTPSSTDAVYEVTFSCMFSRRETDTSVLFQFRYTDSEENVTRAVAVETGDVMRGHGAALDNGHTGNYPLFYRGFVEFPTTNRFRFFVTTETIPDNGGVDVWDAHISILRVS